MNARLHDALPAFGLALVISLVWQAASLAFHIPVFVLPSPCAILVVLVRQQASLLQAALITGEEIAAGFCLSAVVGIAVAMVIARFSLFGRALYPLVVLFQAVPKVALAPLFILWFGFNLFPKILLVVTIAFFPVALNMLAGLQSADTNLIALFYSVGARKTEILYRVQIPHALPQLMAGLKIAVTLSVIGAIVGEFAGASAGLGYVIEFASTQLDTPLVFAALVEVSCLGVLFYYAVALIERRYVFWVPSGGTARLS
jgi:NitT/TauT family transport system permease protein